MKIETNHILGHSNLDLNGFGSVGDKSKQSSKNIGQEVNSFFTKFIVKKFHIKFICLTVRIAISKFQIQDAELKKCFSRKVFIRLMQTK